MGLHPLSDSSGSHNRGKLRMMGWVGISLNLVTALVSSVAVGIGIDYSVHVYSRFRQGIAEGHSPEEAMGSTIANTGRQSP